MSRSLRLLGLLALTAAVAGCAAGRAAPDFTLRDDAAQPWTLSAQRGKAVLLTFGFTHCADTCPETLAKLEHLTVALGRRASDVEIAFMTVDPQRDTPAAMHAFVSRFALPGGSPLVGLTGAPAQIAAAQRAYHVWAQKVPGKHASATQPSGYDEAHSAVIYLIDGRGRIRGLLDDDDSETSLARAVTGMLG